ncbi:unnamed protein product [Rhizophagus irregularis]|uniref:Protein kinase domain-containing protein n=1 Tax=Rhizophagus irregularis TaxID=588596 RepID=A0A915YRG7_9GLOM|nr:unnamed protein product [Rhizophagus irregularis]
MYEVISGLPPYHDISHDENLAIKICQGLRPSIETSVSLSQQIDVSQFNINDDNLPEPKNSVYERNEISMEYSVESLQIDISQLNINKDDKL